MRRTARAMHRAGVAAIVCLSGCGPGAELTDEQVAVPAEEVATSQSAVAITRVIPLRIVFFEQGFICQPPFCVPAAPDFFNIVEPSVQRANENFADAGIKFWVKSVEIVSTQVLGHDQTGQSTWSNIYQEAQALFPTKIIGPYSYEPSKSMNNRNWVDALTAMYGETDVLHVFVEPNSGQAQATHPTAGRSLHIHQCNMASAAGACSGAATSHLAHELGHYFGAQHPDVFDTTKSPITMQPWTRSDQWDELVCLDSGVATFYASKAAAAASGCTNWQTMGRAGASPYPYCTIVPGDLGPTRCTTAYLPGQGPLYNHFSGDPEVNGLTRDLAGVHNPPTTFRYANNVMFGSMGNLGADLAAPTFFNDSSMIKIEAYLNNEIGIATSTLATYKRVDGNWPPGSLAPAVAGAANVVDLGADNQDFVYWGNNHLGGDFTFRLAHWDVTGTAYKPVSGDFDNDGYDDILWYYPGDTTARFWWGNAAGAFQGDNRRGFFSHTGYSHILVGDFDADGRDDLFAYVGGSAVHDYIYWSNSGRTFTPAIKNVGGYYQPIVGNFWGAGDDIFWYYPSGGYGHWWWSNANRSNPFSSQNWYSVDAGGAFVPLVGDFDANGWDDIFWYTASAQDRIWYYSGASKTPSWLANAQNVQDTYLPLVGDFDGDGHSDIFWEHAGTEDHIWPGDTQTNQFLPSLPASAYGTFVPVSGDFNGDGRTDIFWYRGPN